MKNYSKYIWWSVVILVVVIMLWIVGILQEKGIIPSDEIPIAVCEENKIKIESENVFTCINGEWVYTGATKNSKG